MVTTHNLGYPRIGARRELKFALESYWKDQSTRDELLRTGETLRAPLGRPVRAGLGAGGRLFVL